MVIDCSSGGGCIVIIMVLVVLVVIAVMAVVVVHHLSSATASAHIFLCHTLVISTHPSVSLTNIFPLPCYASVHLFSHN